MSVLDRAFIRAFNKDASRDQASVKPPNTELAPESETPGVASRADDLATTAELNDAMCGGQVHRIDPSHPAWIDRCPQPHVQLIRVGCGEDLSYVSPYHEICPPAFPDLPVEVDEDAARPLAEASRAEATAGRAAIEAGETAAEKEPPERHASDVESKTAPMTETPSGPETVEPETVEPETVEPETVEPEQEPPAAKAVADLRQAAAIKVPATLKLPEVFQPTVAPSGKEHVDHATPEFSPDWEVDRFVWPAICQELLEAQSHYFEHVGSRLMAATQESDHVIMISGSRRGEGRSTLAMCLARCAAQAGIKVALVDADLDNPQLGKRLGMETPCSWLEVVSGHTPLQEAAVASVEDHLTLFPLTGEESAEVSRGDGRLVMFVRRISAHYPLVILDTGPMESDATHLFETGAACPIDTAIVVRDLRNTAESTARTTAGRLQRGGIQAVGIAENFRATE